MEITKKELKLLCFLYSFGFISGNVPSEYQTKYVISFGQYLTAAYSRFPRVYGQAH